MYTVYSPSPHTVTKRPFGECCRSCGKISVLPISRVCTRTRSPSVSSPSVSVARFVLSTSALRAHTTLPLVSMLTLGSSLPSLTTTEPSS